MEKALTEKSLKVNVKKTNAFCSICEQTCKFPCLVTCKKGVGINFILYLSNVTIGY